MGNSFKFRWLLLLVPVIALAPMLTAGDERGQTVPVQVPEKRPVKVAAKSGAAAKEVPPSEFSSGSPTAGQIEGFTEPYADIRVAAAEMGTLAHVAVQEGDHVRSGDLLANLDEGVLQASLEVARAGMSAEGELKSAQTQLDLRNTELRKLKELFDRNHASQQELDRVTGEVRLAEARLQSVREDLEVRRLEFARIQAQLNQRRIVSPIDGVVTDLLKDSGEFVSPSDPVVARVVQLDPLLVVFSVPAARRSEIVRGQAVAMKIGEADGAGLVEFVSPTVDPSSGTFRVKIRLPNPDRRWHGGEKSLLLLNQVPPALAAGKDSSDALK
ncbi:MAG: efflux RND transporter periplasmic adaptor subunit [Planctomycetaceae bacterium]|nr:efflux RND transporter periplasmic adaptor subunit [Planctomycetaceae bacterium]